MPKAIKKRVPKKKAIEENEVRGAMMQALDALKERQKQVVIGAVVVLAVILLAAGIKIYSSSVYEEAYSIAMQANDYYYGAEKDGSAAGEERWKKAMELYQQSIDVKLTPTALFYLGNCYFNIGDYDGAIRKYSVFEEKFRGDTGILPLVYQKLASSYFRTNQNDKAIEALNRLAGLQKGIFKDTALVIKARHYDSTGDRQKALEMYGQIVAEFPSSIWSLEANAKVTSEESAKTGPEVEGAVESPGGPAPEIAVEPVQTQSEEPTP